VIGGGACLGSAAFATTVFAPARAVRVGVSDTFSRFQALDRTHQEVGQMDSSSFNKAWGKVVAKAWQDPVFAKRMHEDPAAAFKDLGADLPERVRVRVVDASPGELVLVFPPAPTDEVEELLKANGVDPTVVPLCACVRELCHSW
jgi:hypothetical protein